jgi:hypothetical protein
VVSNICQSLYMGVHASGASTDRATYRQGVTAAAYGGDRSLFPPLQYKKR